MVTEAKLITSGEAKSSLNRADQMKQDMDRIDRFQREKTEFEHGFANIIYKSLMLQIHDFEQTLKPNEQIGTYVTSFGQQILVGIERVEYAKPYLIIFHGINELTGAKVRLVQHVSQTCILFEVMEVPQGRKPRRIGFLPNEDKTQLDD